MPPKYEGSQTVTENLKRLMYEQHLSQEALSKLSGVERSAISVILNGGNFRMSTLGKLAKGLGVDSWTILMKPPEPEAATTEPSEDIAKALRLLMALAKGAK